jgi:hypothetical protein
MSKKDNLKFKKRIKAQILQEISQSQPDLPDRKPDIAKPTVLKSVIKPAEPVMPSLGDVSIKLVRSDLKKSAIIIGSIVILIIAIYFIDNKTGFLLKAGNQLFKTLHINSTA